ncbi:hypothetical protein [Actinomadura sp. 6N118]|uniref:hypothetical protein n=1 Tax=Actinomadura sp. 6N118 TaxID=3375151 RepID=UPI0037BF4786
MSRLCSILSTNPTMNKTTSGAQPNGARERASTAPVRGESNALTMPPSPLENHDRSARP